MRYPKVQTLQSLDPRDYKIVCCVSGTRGYNDRRYFHERMVDFIEMQNGPVLFVSGAAYSGADDLIIRWCDKFRYPCLRMPADWDTEPRAAGFIRNEEMSKIITYLIAFWDGVSNGTNHMIQCCEKRKLPMEVIRIPPIPKPDRNAKLPRSDE
jgi:hypothetical protein